MNSVFDYGGKPINKNTAIAMSGGTNYDPDFKEADIVLFTERPMMNGE
jgi:hypothetical protein